jgi:hypothetical protein
MKYIQSIPIDFINRYKDQIENMVVQNRQFIIKINKL